jgi:hypothetical protein
MYYRRKERGENHEFTAEELTSCMKNQQPGLDRRDISNDRFARTGYTLLR